MPPRRPGCSKQPDPTCYRTGRGGRRRRTLVLSAVQVGRDTDRSRRPRFARFKCAAWTEQFKTAYGVLAGLYAWWCERCDTVAWITRSARQVGIPAEYRPSIARVGQRGKNYGRVSEKSGLLYGQRKSAAEISVRATTEWDRTRGACPASSRLKMQTPPRGDRRGAYQPALGIGGIGAQAYRLNRRQPRTLHTHDPVNSIKFA